VKGDGIGGLSADEMGSKYLIHTHEFFPVTWIKNEPGEELSSYVLRLQN
jgi:hypothetical protein